MHTAIESIKHYVRAANYLTVTQIYLQDNFLLERPLRSTDIKPKLFGHWGTCPGINFVYANLNHLVKKHKQSVIFVLGPGHGMPGLQANLFLEGTLQKYYPQATLDEKGIGYISKMFAWPYGFSSHCSPETPGLILEGGELGYSLSSAYGAVMDNPDLLAACLIGDGEAETGAIAAAWHLNKLIDPATNGAVLPILHVNGYKISGPTIFGRMSKAELTSLFTGYGYEPFFVGGADIYEEMMATLEMCYQRIRAIQQEARNGKSVTRPRFPMIILQTPKGWTTIKKLRGQAVEGTILSHQVVMPNVRADEQELAALEEWLRSYKFAELFDKENGFSKKVHELIPTATFRMGDNAHMFGKHYKPLNVPDVKKLAKKVETPGTSQSNSMRLAGTYLREVFVLNKKQKNFRLMSPDETYSNRLDEVFRETSRGFVWPILASDKDITVDGRVMEMLSEHNMHGLTQGYVLTGRHAVFTTYEAFAQIFSSMSHMYQKFLKYVRLMSWRQDIPSLTYLLTSTAWRQEHNGYSHQNPSFISGMLDKHNDFVKVYFPVDDNSMLAVLEETMTSTNHLNTIVAGKTPEPRWMSYPQAKKALQDGIATWDAVSDANPHVVLVGIGDYVTKEALAALALIRKDAPSIRVRFVNMLRLQAACSCPDEFHEQIPHAEKYFTVDKPVIVNFHGYPEVIQAMIMKVKHPERFSIHGYREEGGTTTPFDMQVRNQTDRYHLAIELLEKVRDTGVLSGEDIDSLIAQYKKRLEEHYAYILKHGADPTSVETWQWSDALSDTQKDTAPSFSDILLYAKTIAVVGLSDKEERHSNRVARYFQGKGYRIIPINPKLTEVLGEKSYPSLAAVPKDIHIDIVDIFRRPTEVIPHLQEVVDRGDIRTVWLQDGVSSPAAVDFADDYGLSLVTNFCIMDAYKELEKGAINSDSSETNIIHKQLSSLVVAPNLVDYDATYKTFSWKKAEKQFVDFFPDGKMNIAYNCVDRHVLSNKQNKTALIFADAQGGRETYSYAALAKLTNRFANVLVSQKIVKGDRVFLFLPSIPERLVAFLGAMKAGAIAGTLFSAFQEMALRDRLADAQAKVVVTNAALYPRIEAIWKDLPYLEKVIIVERGEGDLPKGKQIVSYEKAMQKASPKFEAVHMNKDDYAYMLYTSGTTGKPKGVVHSHGDGLQAMVTTQYALDVQDSDVYWCTADIGWVTGVVYGILGPLGLGATSLMYEGRFSPENWYGLLAKYKVTVWYTAPTAIRLLMGANTDLRQFDLSSLRHLCSVGEPLNPEAIWWGLKAYGLPFHDTWWQTELGGISVTNYPTLDIKPGSMGKPLPGIIAAIIDDAGNEVPMGEEGNLALKASTVSSLMKTIWHNKQKFDSYFMKGWYISGDRAYKDADGYFWFIGRSDDVINTSGERIGPFEVESALVAYPDVIEAGVIGKPDAVRGEIIKAFVVVKSGVKKDEELKKKLKAHVKQMLAGHSYPREIDFINKLPKTRSGKIMRRVLKAQELGQEVGDTSTLEEY